VRSGRCFAAGRAFQSLCCLDHAQVLLHEVMRLLRFTRANGAVNLAMHLGGKLLMRHQEGQKNFHIKQNLLACGALK